MSHSFAVRVGLAWGLALVAVGCRPSPPGAPAAPALDGHQRMLVELQSIRQRTEVEHPFLGTLALRAAERELQLAEAAERARPEELCRLHGEVGEQLLRFGRAEEAIRHWQTALELAEQDSQLSGLVSHIHYRLAVACIRLGENQNCVHCTNGEGCLLPIRGGGVHRQKAGSEQAVPHLEAVLQRRPGDLKARWLLNIAHMTLGTFPDGVPEPFRFPPEAFAQQVPDVSPYRNVASVLGLDTLNTAGGVILDDFNGDDYLDVITSAWDTGGQLLMFVNQRNGTFVETTSAAGLEGLYGGLNLVQADYDNDGDVDVLVLRGAWLEAAGRHPKSLLQNDGQGRFRDVTFDAGLGAVHYPSQTAGWADFDNDGDLDLYVGNEQYPSQLFENDGKGRFTDVAERAGVTNDRLAKGVTWGDFDRDRWPDLYVSNLPGENRLYRNSRDGTFTDVAQRLHVAQPLHSFPCWFWDYNNDGLLDLYVSSFQPGLEHVAADYLGRPATTELDRFYRGTADGRFEDATDELGFTRCTLPMGANFGDLNNDGFVDMYLGTGYVDYEGLIPNLMFLNRGGRRFEDVTFAARVGHLQKGHGVALADLDSDGDLDIFAQLGGWFAGDAFANALFENPGGAAHWLEVRLIGRTSNRSGIGARIRLTTTEAGERRDQYRWVNSGGSFGANPLRQHFGLGSATEIDALEVYWPTSDQTQVWRRLEVDQRIELTEGETAYRSVSLRASAWPETPQ